MPFDEDFPGKNTRANLCYVASIHLAERQINPKVNKFQIESGTYFLRMRIFTSSNKFAQKATIEYNQLN